MNEHRIHQVFRIGILLKGLHGMIECAGGLVLAVTTTGAIVALANRLTQGELSEEPHDFVASHLMAWAGHVTHSDKTFYVSYLLAHGFIKILLVAALLRGLLWAYPVSLAVLGLFMLYQIARFAQTESLFMLILTLFDGAVMWLIWHEYGLMKGTARRRAAAARCKPPGQ